MSVYRRGKSWYVNITIAGHRIHRKAGSTKKQAETIASELKTRYRLKQLSMADIKRDTLFADIADEYLYYVQDTKSARTYELEATDHKKHLDPYFGGMIAQDIDEETLRRFQGRQKNKGLANRTINMHIGLIRKILYHDKIRKVGDIQFPMLQESQKIFMFLTPDEIERIMKHFTHSLALKRSLFGYMSGMRPAELAYLSWSDVDFEMNTVKITSKPPLWIIKTKQERVIPLNNTALQILKDLYIKRRSHWVFSNNNKPVKSNRRAINTAAKRAGIKRKITPNMLRHSFASILLLKGVDIKTVMELMGHTSIGTTQKYLHAVSQQLKKAVSLLD